MQTGIGSFAIDKGTPRDSKAHGSIVLTYGLFSRGPLDEHFTPDTDMLSNGKLRSAAASVTVAVPEPATWLLALTGSVLLLALRRRSMPRRQRDWVKVGEQI